MASGDFLDLSEWAARSARFDTSSATDMTRAKAAINDAYLSSCATGDPFDFLQQEGTWVTVAGADVYTYASIATAMSLTGAIIAEIEDLTDDDAGYTLESGSWADLEKYAQSTQDDGPNRPTKFAKWQRRIRLYPTPVGAYTIGTFVRLEPSEMTADTDVPLVPGPWRRRLLVPYAASVLLRTEGGLEAHSEADRYMEQYNRDFTTFRTAYATGKKASFRVATFGWETMEPAGRNGFMP